MARGWENKAVESMMDDHDNRPKHREPERSPEQIAYDKKRGALELSRRGVENDLARATHPRHRAQLEAALAHLDGQLAALARSAPAENPAHPAESQPESQE